MQVFIKKFICTTILFFSLVSFGQSANDKVVYLDSLGRDSDSINYAIKRIIREYSLDKNKYLLEEFTKKSLVFSVEVTDKDLLIKNGNFTFFYENGNKKKTGIYEKNSILGNSTEWYENGKIKAEFLYVFKNNVYESNVISYWDENEVQKVKEGNGFCEFKINSIDKEVVLRGNVLNGLFEGKWNTTPEEYPYFEEYYSKGKLLNGVRKDSKYKSIYYTEVSVQPSPKDGMNEFRKFIGSQIKTKKQKSKIDGTVIVKFFVDSQGKIQNPIIVKSLNDYFDTQIIKVLKNSEKWTPGTYRGVNVKAYYTLPVKIKVDESN